MQAELIGLGDRGCRVVSRPRFGPASPLGGSQAHRVTAGVFSSRPAAAWTWTSRMRPQEEVSAVFHEQSMRSAKPGPQDSGLGRPVDPPSTRVGQTKATRPTSPSPCYLVGQHQGTPGKDGEAHAPQSWGSLVNTGLFLPHKYFYIQESSVEAAVHPTTRDCGGTRIQQGQRWWLGHRGSCRGS